MWPGAQTVQSTPQSGKKRARKKKSPSNSQQPNSPESSPETGPTKKRTMPLFSDEGQAIMNKLNAMDKKSDGMDEKLTKLGISLGSMKTDISSVQTSVEILKKQLLMKSVVIYGIGESPNEDTQTTEQKVQGVANQIGLPSLDVDMIRRMGLPRKGRNRPIELTLLRQKDKLLLMNARHKLKDIDSTKNIYINNARTDLEHKNYHKLLAFARGHRAHDQDTKFRIIRDRILEITSKSANGQYEVDPEGIVVPCKSPARGNPVRSDILSSQQSSQNGSLESNSN